MRKEELICEVLSNIGEITVYKDGCRNTFDVKKDDVCCLPSFSDYSIIYKVFGTLKKEEIFHLSLGDAYFYANGKPCHCRIPQINHPKEGFRDNHEIIIIIKVRKIDLIKGSVISDFHMFFSQYEGPIFEEEKNEEINNRFEILDL